LIISSMCSKSVSKCHNALDPVASGMARFGSLGTRCSTLGALGFFPPNGLRCSFLPSFPFPTVLSFKLDSALFFFRDGNDAGMASGLGIFADRLECASEVTEGDMGNSGPVRSDLSLFPLTNRSIKDRPGLLVLGDRCELGSLAISLNELGVGLAGRRLKLVFDVKAELRADDENCGSPRRKL